MLNGIIPATWSSHILAALRVMAGLLFIQHGLPKFTGWPSVEMIGDGFPITSFFGALGLVEAILGVLIVLGLFTRLIAFLLSGFMAVAYFMAHAPQGFFPINNMGESAIFFCFIFLYLAAAGGGSFSLDSKRA
jgi:putative oxidoreductase